MEWIQPESYLADDDYLSFVTANNPLFARVREAMAAIRS
jgi:hypothetical protein